MELARLALEKYFQTGGDGSIKSIAPFGFTGQGCIWYGSTAPAGWLICDGSTVNIDDYHDLYELWKNESWLTSTSTTFNLPDLRERVPAGKHSSGTFATLGSAVGAETSNLDHTHDVVGTTGNMQNLTSGVAMTGGGTNINHRHAISITSTQPSITMTSVSRVQKTRVVNFIVKT